MDYQLKIKKQAATLFEIVDLFPDSVIGFDLDFYDSDNIDKIKVPVSIGLSIPMTPNNVSIIDYDPTSSTLTTTPTSPFDFELYLNGNKVLEGSLYIESYAFNNSIPLVNVRLVDRLQEVFSNSKEVSLASMYSDYDVLTSFDALLSQEEGVIGSIPATDDIVFPYIDMCNDTEKFDYAARQFLQFGFSDDKSGIIPAFNVPSFLERFFSEAGVGVTSRFFQLGSYDSAIPNTSPDRMYMALPTRLEAGSRTRTRGFMVLEGPYEFCRNEFTKDLDVSLSTAREVDIYPYTTFGWNYSTTPYSNNVEDDFGIQYRTNVPNTGEEIDRAFFGSNISYNAKPIASVAQDLEAGSWIGFDIPMVKLNENDFAIVQQINGDDSTAVFNIIAKLWVDGEPKYSFRMCDAQSGDVKNLTISDSNVEEMFSSLSGYEANINNSGSWLPIFEGDSQNPRSFNNQVRFSDTEIGNFIWEQKEIEITAGSVYSMSIDFEIVSGTLDLEYVPQWYPDPNLSGKADYDPLGLANGTFKDGDITKAIYREDLNAVRGQLYLGFNSTGSFNPYFSDDDVNVIWGLQSSDVSPYEVTKEIIKRFNLSVVYDQNENTILIDRLPDLRSVNASENITEKIDDAEEIEVEVVTRLAKSLEIKTSQNSLYHDKFGYGVVELNGAGSDELKFSLASRVYNTSLSGDSVFIEIPDGFNEYEIGFTINEFTSYKDIGVTFGFIEAPQYTTSIRRAKFVEKNNSKTLIYNVFKTHVFPRFVSEIPNTMSLNHFDEQGNTTDLFDFFSGNDNVQFYAKPTIKFKALFNSDYAFNVKDNYAVVSMDYINSQDIVIKSFSGDMFDGGIYGTIEAIIL